MNTNLIISIFLLVVISAYGQTTPINRATTHIFWQPSIKIVHKDFQGDTLGAVMDHFKKYDYKASASVGLWSILDVPKKKRDRGKKLEKVYFAAAFDKKGSVAITEDSMQIAIQAVYFDICEIAARFARKELKQLQDSLKGYGTLYLMYSTIAKDAEELRLKMNASYAKDVILDKKEGAFESWRKFFDELLDETKEFATTKEECDRFIKNEPIEPGYEKSPTVASELN